MACPVSVQTEHAPFSDLDKIASPDSSINPSGINSSHDNGSSTGEIYVQYSLQTLIQPFIDLSVGLSRCWTPSVIAHSIERPPLDNPSHLISHTTCHIYYDTMQQPTSLTRRCWRQGLCNQAWVHVTCWCRVLWISTMIPSTSCRCQRMCSPMLSGTPWWVECRVLGAAPGQISFLYRPLQDKVLLAIPQQWH